LPLEYTYKELSFRDGFDKHPYALFFTAFPASHPIIGKYLETLNAMGYRIVCVHYLFEHQFLTKREQRESDKKFTKYVDYYYPVPVRNSFLDADSHLVNKHVYDWCDVEAVQEVKKICDKFPINVCFVTHNFFSLVFEEMSTRIRKVLILRNSFLDKAVNMCSTRICKVLILRNSFLDKTVNMCLTRIRKELGLRNSFLDKAVNMCLARIRKELILRISFPDKAVNICLTRIAMPNPANLSEGEERLACQRADVVVATSKSGCVLAKRLVPQKEVYCFPVVPENERFFGKIDRMQVMQKLLARPFIVTDGARNNFLHYHDVMMKYLYHYIKDPKDKVFVEIGPDNYLSCASTLMENGADRIIVLQTLQALQKLSQNCNDLPAGVEYQVVSPMSWDSIKDSSIDVVYGFAVLEHITHFEEIACEIYRVLKPGGYVLLQGCPLWGSAYGHHLVVTDAETGKIKYDFAQADKNPIESWMHLVLTEQEMKEELVQKNISAQNAHEIVDMIYHSDIGSNKKLVDEIVPAFKKRLSVEAIRYLGNSEKNEYYQMARERYSEKDLETDCFIIYAQKSN